MNISATRGWFAQLRSGEPHQVIGPPATPYLLPRNPFINVYLHRFCSSDPSAPHDHPWHFLSIVLSGRYREIGERRTLIRKPGSVAIRRASSRHQVELLGGPVTTVIVTGPRHRAWGFWCPQPLRCAHFVPWQEFGLRGCGEPTGTAALTDTHVRQPQVTLRSP